MKILNSLDAKSSWPLFLSACSVRNACGTRLPAPRVQIRIVQQRTVKPPADTPPTQVCPYLDPKSTHNHGPKPIKIAQKAIILHTLGAQIGLHFECCIHHRGTPECPPWTGGPRGATRRVIHVKSTSDYQSHVFCSFPKKSLQFIVTWIPIVCKIMARSHLKMAQKVAYVWGPGNGKLSDSA